MNAQLDMMRRANRLLVGTKADLDKYSGEAFDDSVLTCETWRQDLYESLFGEKRILGHRLPWPSLDDRFRLRPGELTIWAGVNGHGKSLLLNQVMICCMRQGAKVVIASLELHPVETLARMVCQMSGVVKKFLTEDTVEDFFMKVMGWLWLYAETGDMQPDRVLAMCRWARNELDAEHVVIDSLMKCGTLEGDYAAEKKLVNSLQNIAKQTGLHIHLVAHSRKLKDETQQMGKFDVIGSGMITNMADNVITIARNKAKEAELLKPDPSEKLTKQSDTLMICTKQRHGNWEGYQGLYFHESGQFSERIGAPLPIW